LPVYAIVNEGFSMLKELRIKNLAIIDDLAVRFEKGLNVLTGETGTGKSIIVDALGLALGDRAQSDLVKSGEKEAIVQAYFETGSDESLPDVGIDVSEEILLRRVISSSGKSRAYVNDTMVTQQTLSEVGKALVDIHSQHEHQSLLKPEKQRKLLDSYGKLENERESVEHLFREVRMLKTERETLREKVKERAHRLDLLRFQTNEIDAASIEPGEKEKLAEEKRILSNVSRLNENAEKAYSLLYESDGSCFESLSKIIGLVRDMYSIDSATEETLKLLETAMPLLEDAAISMRGLRDRYELDPDRLEMVTDRVEMIRKLERKYGEGAESILRYRENAEEEMKGLESTDEKLIFLEESLRVKEEELLKAAEALSEKRKKTALALEGMIVSTLKDLAFGNAAFKIGIELTRGEDGENTIRASGMDKVEFLFSANPGEPPRPLSKIASGGELSRVMLALKSILADVDSVPVLIFDEVDAGIGGRTAESVGKKLDMLSGKHQLLCITHLPQIARYGAFHLRIEKKNKQDKVCVEVHELEGRERIDEIARMLSGKVTEISLRHAGELLERAK
jgi:DNA repair protein RecN (Recombination protein N)